MEVNEIIKQCSADGNVLRLPKMDMEVAALRYKCNAFEQFRRIIYNHEEN